MNDLADDVVGAEGESCVVVVGYTLEEDPSELIAAVGANAATESVGADAEIESANVFVKLGRSEEVIVDCESVASDVLA